MLLPKKDHPNVINRRKKSDLSHDRREKIQIISQPNSLSMAFASFVNITQSPPPLPPLPRHLLRRSIFEISPYRARINSSFLTAVDSMRMNFLVWWRSKEDAQNGLNFLTCEVACCDREMRRDDTLMQRWIERGMDPSDGKPAAWRCSGNVLVIYSHMLGVSVSRLVADVIFDGIERDHFYIHTHPEVSKVSGNQATESLVGMSAGPVDAWKRSPRGRSRPSGAPMA